MRPQRSQNPCVFRGKYTPEFAGFSNAAVAGVQPVLIEALMAHKGGLVLDHLGDLTLKELTSRL
jgi:hypothetical protein